MSDWTTPKQIKIEKLGPPRRRHRGILKKGERHKGKKARMDEIHSARQRTLRYRDWIVGEWKRFKEHPEWYRPLPKGYPYRSYNPRYDDWFNIEQKRLNALIDKAIADGILGEVDRAACEVEKPWHWPFQRINSNGAREYACRHGVGHGGTHGCDGCCGTEEAKLAIHYQTKPEEFE